jgi:hypothetical protein
VLCNTVTGPEKKWDSGGGANGGGDGVVAGPAADRAGAANSRGGRARGIYVRNKYNKHPHSKAAAQLHVVGPVHAVHHATCHTPHADF